MTYNYRDSASQQWLIVDERMIYGSSRLGIDGLNDTLVGIYGVVPVANYYERKLGTRGYELVINGNVLATISDNKIARDSEVRIRITVALHKRFM